MASNYSISAICGWQTFSSSYARFQWLFFGHQIVLGLFFLVGEYSFVCVLMFRLLAHDHCSSDNVSLASDLTRMYVSDEDDRLERTEIRVPHYH